MRPLEAAGVGFIGAGLASTGTGIDAGVTGGPGAGTVRAGSVLAGDGESAGWLEVTHGRPINRTMISMAAGPIAPIASRPSDRDRTADGAAGGAVCTCVLPAGSTGCGDIRRGSDEGALASAVFVAFGGAGNSIFAFGCGPSSASFSDRVSAADFDGGASTASFSSWVSTAVFVGGASTAGFGGVAGGSAATLGCAGGFSTPTFCGGVTTFGGPPTATFFGGAGGSVTFGGAVGNSIGFP